MRALGKKNTNRLITGVILFILILVAVTMIVPYLWMLSSSFKRGKDLFTEQMQWIPNPWVWSNYSKVFIDEQLYAAFFNTAKIFVPVLIVGMFTTSLASFSFAKLHFRGKQIAFMGLLATMMIPFPVVMIPQFIFFVSVGLRDSYLPLILPGLLGNISAIFFIVQFLKNLPDSLIDSAKIDGAGYFTIYWRIVLPNIKPALATQAIFWFMAIWNDLLGPIIYLDSVEKYTITAKLASLNTMNNTLNQLAQIMAGSVLASLPLIIIYIIFQKQIINSLAFSGIKG